MAVNRSILNMFLGKKVRLIKRDGSVEVGTLKPFKTKYCLVKDVESTFTPFNINQFVALKEVE